MSRCGRYNQHVKLAAAFLLVACGSVIYGADEPSVIGSVTSTSPIIIDRTSMSPAAAPSWPVVDRDEIETTTDAAFLVTPERNRVVLYPGAIVNSRRTESGELYVYLRKGGLSFNVRSRRIYICAGGSLFVAKSPTSGVVRVEESGGVFDRLDTGKFEEKGKRVCNEQGVVAIITGGVAGAAGSAGIAGAGSAGAGAAGAGAAGAGAAGAGAAVGGAAVSGATAAGSLAAGAASIAAAGVGAASTAAASAFATASTPSSSSACGASGCNFVPPPVSVSGP
jgi:hypothetical protein